VSSAADASTTASGGWDWRRVVFGDWTLLVRDPLDVLRYAFIGGTVAFALMHRSTAVALTAASAILLIARVINLPRWFDFTLIVAMTAIAWGTALSLYGDWFYYDKIVHSVAPFCYAPVLYIVLVRLNVVPDPAGVHTVSRRAGIFITTLALGMAVGAGYENVEWIEDQFNILGGHFVKGLWDTETDLLCDAAGSLAAAIFLTIWSIRRWTSTRIPGEPLSSAQGSRIHKAREASRALAASTASAWESRFDGIPVVLKGVADILAGALLLAWPTPTLRTVEIVVGVALAVRAVLGIVEFVRRRGARHLVEGVAEIAASVVLLSWPGKSLDVFLHTVGAAIVLFAVLEAAALSMDGRSTRERWIGGAVAVGALSFGVALLALPMAVFGATMTALGIYLVIVGALRVFRVLRSRETARSMTSGK
jgi:uncharacterized membrane protein HdeD (DUF308 family)